MAVAVAVTVAVDTHTHTHTHTHKGKIRIGRNDFGGNELPDVHFLTHHWFS